jgi:hypothetical protein
MFLMTITATVDQIPTIVEEAKQAAHDAATKYFNEVLGGTDRYACGFAWLDIYDVRSNSKIGKTLQQAGFRKSYSKTIQLWNPSKFPCQNVDTLEAGAVAAANVFRKYGFTAYAGSRLD